MPPAKTVYVPRFGSQQDSGQKHEPQPGQTGSSSRGQTGSSSRGQEDKSGNKRANDGREKTPGLKVKLPKLNRGSLLAKVKKEIKTPTKWMLDRAANKSETAVNLGAETRCADTGSALADGDVFFFSQRCNTKATNVKEKAKLSVLRTISKMLEENQLIRQRLAALSQVG